MFWGLGTSLSPWALRALLDELSLEVLLHPDWITNGLNDSRAHLAGSLDLHCPPPHFSQAQSPPLPRSAHIPPSTLPLPVSTLPQLPWPSASMSNPNHLWWAPPCPARAANPLYVPTHPSQALEPVRPGHQGQMPDPSWQPLPSLPSHSSRTLGLGLSR